MKKYIILSTILVSAYNFAQVGINTNNPQGILNIDGAKDNPTSGTSHTAEQQLNDFTVLSNGNTGIGTISPSQKLEIQTGGTAEVPVTGFKLSDGNQRKNYALTSDENGVGTWKLVTVMGINGKFVPANSSNSKYYFSTQENTYVNTGSYIDLPPGKWRIDITQLLRPDYTNNQLLVADDYIFVRFTFTDSETSTSPMAESNFGSNVVEFAAGSFSGPLAYGVLKYEVVNGTIILKNNSTDIKRYYLLAGNSLASNSYRESDVGSNGKVGTVFFRNIGSSSWRENRIVAMPLNND